MMKKSLSKTNPQLTAQWHPTKNGDLKPIDVTAGSAKKVWWLYPYDDPKTGKHFDFEWEATIHGRNCGDGCPYLNNSRIWIGFNDLATTHPNLAAEWHPTKNGDLKPIKHFTHKSEGVWAHIAVLTHCNDELY